jgi:cytochrome c-type biogenesis protein CcmH
MIWFVWLFGFSAVLGASQLTRAMGRGDRAVIAVLLAGFLASLGYLFVGRAGLPDQPYKARIAKLETVSPERRTRAEVLAQFENLILEQPDNPRPHFVIGEMLVGEGRDEDAIRAFQSALRRDETFVPAMIGMADAVTRLGGGVIGPQAKRIYKQAVSVDPKQIHAGFMVGVAEWQAGDDDAAQLAWDGLWLRLGGNEAGQRSLAERVAAVTGQTIGVGLQSQRLADDVPSDADLQPNTDDPTQAEN